MNRAIVEKIILTTMSEYHSLRVKQIVNETVDTCSIIFDVPEHLASDFTYTQGQYLSLKKMINGEEVIRAYSLSSAPYEDAIKVSVKKIEGGKFSTFATQELREGDVLEVFPPRGSFFTDLASTNSKNYLAFATGSGITPVISILKATLNQEVDSNFTLFYGNRDAESTIFRSELIELVAASDGRLVVHDVYTREDSVADVMKGRLSSDKCKEFKDAQLLEMNQVDEVFLCGPQEMVESISKFLQNEGIDKKNIHFELFYAAPAKVDKGVEEEHADFEEAIIKLIIDDEEYEFKSPRGKFILDTAIEEDLDVPFSCKSGVCCTCRAKVTNGKVKMLNNYALEQDEVKEGYVLSCQAIPLTEYVTLDMDE